MNRERERERTESKDWIGNQNSIYTTVGAYSGALFDHSFAVTKVLLSFTERLELKW